MELTIHKGSSKIGGTCLEISTPSARIIFDIGDDLPDIKKKKKRSGISDNLLIDFSGLDKKKIDALFISHIHGEQLGLIEKLESSTPIYMGRYAYNVWSLMQDFTDRARISNPIRFISSQEPVTIKDLTITPFIIEHSAFDAYAFLIEWNGEKIFYTGDFRAHGFAGKYAQIFQKNLKLQDIDRLIIEGVDLYEGNSLSESEEDFREKAENIIKTNEGNVFILQSAANISRIRSLYEATRLAEKTLVVDMFTAHILKNSPKSIPNPFTYEGIKLFLPKSLPEEIIKEKPHLFYPYAKYRLSPEALSQGTDMVILIRDTINYDIVKEFKKDNAHLLYLNWERYKTEEETSRLLSYFNGNVTEFTTARHANISIIKDYIDTLKPKNIIPIHTETLEKYIEYFDELAAIESDNKLFTIEY
ncbi:MAG: hypothetical protein LBV43_14395 [Prevotella sp.]|jgi:ribonuclease J|nr:hypothetical protein [Prevotella sp.]